MNLTRAIEIMGDAYCNLGTISGYNEVARDLRKRAGDMFARDRDSEAKVYRRLAAEREATADVLRKRYDAKDHQNLGAAVAFLKGLEEKQQEETE